MEEKEPSPIPPIREEDRGVLLSAGVCMRVPFSRVSVKQPAKTTKTASMDHHVDFAGVSQGFISGSWGGGGGEGLITSREKTFVDLC